MADERNTLKGYICKKEHDKTEQLLHRAEDTISDDMQEVVIDTAKESLSHTIKIATWNLKDFCTKSGVSKIKIALVFATIIAKKFDIIALQDVGEEADVIGTEKAAIQRLYRMLQDSEDTWQMSITGESIGKGLQKLPCYGVILWNSKDGLSMEDELTCFSASPFTRKPVIGDFRIGNWKFSLVSFHLANVSRDREVKRISDVVAANHGRHGDLILLGTFDTYVSGIYYENLLTKEEKSNTALEGITRSTDTYDGIIITSKLKKRRYRTHSLGSICESEDFKAYSVSPRRPVWVMFHYSPIEKNGKLSKGFEL